MVEFLDIQEGFGIASLPTSRRLVLAGSGSLQASASIR